MDLTQTSIIAVGVRVYFIF